MIYFRADFSVLTVSLLLLFLLVIKTEVVAKQAILVLFISRTTKFSFLMKKLLGILHIVG